MEVRERKQKIMQTIAPPVAHHPEAAQLKGRFEQEAAASLLAAFEAAVRLSLMDLGQQTDNPIRVSETSQGLLTQAVAYGIIDPEDRDVLLRILPMRDAAARGSAEAIDVGVLQEVSRLTKRILDEINQQSD